MARRKVPYGGGEIEAEDIPFRVIEDGTMTLELADGANLRLRPIVLNVLRTDERNPEGERVYLVQSVVSVLLFKAASEETEPREKKQ
jgi:hypothetical protein